MNTISSERNANYSVREYTVLLRIIPLPSSSRGFRYIYIYIYITRVIVGLKCSFVRYDENDIQSYRCIYIYIFFTIRE